MGLVVVAFTATGPSVAPGEGEASVAPTSQNDPHVIDWGTLRGLDYRTGERSAELDALDGEEVRIAGFTVPFEDWMTSASEFLLVPYAGACVHTPAPPPHQLVYVEMQGSRRASLAGMQAPMWIEGVLHIEETNSVYGQAGFRIEGTRVFPYPY